MKRTLYLAVLVACALVASASSALAQQSLGDVARQQRQGKHPSSAKVYTNDDFAPVPNAPAPAATAAAGSDKGEKSDAKPEDKAKMAEEFKAKAKEQKGKIDLLQRELEVAQREYKLKVAVYYADVGNNLRDSKKWAEDDRKQRAEIDGKQKAVEDAKQKLADLQEQARKAGIRIE